MNGSDNVWTLSNNAVLSCAVCQEEHVAEEVVIVRMPCGHCICLSGFHQLESTACPCCRTTFDRDIEIPKELIRIWENKMQRWVTEAVDARHELDVANAVIVREAVAELMLPYESPPPRRRRNRRRRRSTLPQTTRRNIRFRTGDVSPDIYSVE